MHLEERASTLVTSTEPIPPLNTDKLQKPVCSLVATAVTAEEVTTHKLGHRAYNLNFMVDHSRLIQKYLT